MFGKGTTHKLKLKSLQPLTPPLDLVTLMSDSKQLVQYATHSFFELDLSNGSDLLRITAGASWLSFVIKC